MLVLVASIHYRCIDDSKAQQESSTNLVELLQVLNSHEGELLVELLGLVDVGSIGENAELHTGTGDVGELDSARLELSVLDIQQELGSQTPCGCLLSGGPVHADLLSTRKMPLWAFCTGRRLIRFWQHSSLSV